MIFYDIKCYVHGSVIFPNTVIMLRTGVMFIIIIQCEISTLLESNKFTWFIILIKKLDLKFTKQKCIDVELTKPQIHAKYQFWI